MTQRTSLTIIQSAALSMPEADNDTVVIFLARFLVQTAREVLGRYAFHERRFADDGAPLDDCMRHRPNKVAAAIVVAGANLAAVNAANRFFGLT